MRYVFIFIALLLISKPSFAFDGLVTAVHDGDTLTVKNEQGLDENIRVQKIDAPELKSTKWSYQPYASESRTALLNLCLGKVAKISRTGRSYNRTVAAINCNGQDVTLYQLQNGNAWFYRYSSGKSLKNSADKSKSEGIGLWQLPSQIEPYLWRKRRF